MPYGFEVGGDFDSTLKQVVKDVQIIDYVVSHYLYRVFNITVDDHAAKKANYKLALDDYYFLLSDSEFITGQPDAVEVKEAVKNQVKKLRSSVKHWLFYTYANLVSARVGDYVASGYDYAEELSEVMSSQVYNKTKPMLVTAGADYTPFTLLAEMPFPAWAMTALKAAVVALVDEKALQIDLAWANEVDDSGSEFELEDFDSIDDRADIDALEDRVSSDLPSTDSTGSVKSQDGECDNAPGDCAKTDFVRFRC